MRRLAWSVSQRYCSSPHAPCAGSRARTTWSSSCCEVMVDTACALTVASTVACVAPSSPEVYRAQWRRHHDAAAGDPGPNGAGPREDRANRRTPGGEGAGAIEGGAVDAT